MILTDLNTVAQNIIEALVRAVRTFCTRKSARQSNDVAASQPSMHTRGSGSSKACSESLPCANGDQAHTAARDNARELVNTRATAYISLNESTHNCSRDVQQWPAMSTLAAQLRQLCDFASSAGL